MACTMMARRLQNAANCLSTTVSLPTSARAARKHCSALARFHLVPEDAAEIGARCVLPLPRRLLLVQIRHESPPHGAVLGEARVLPLVPWLCVSLETNRILSMAAFLKPFHSVACEPLPNITRGEVPFGLAMKSSRSL